MSGVLILGKVGGRCSKEECIEKAYRNILREVTITEIGVLIPLVSVSL